MFRALSPRGTLVREDLVALVGFVTLIDGQAPEDVEARGTRHIFPTDERIVRVVSVAVHPDPI